MAPVVRGQTFEVRTTFTNRRLSISPTCRSASRPWRLGGAQTGVRHLARPGQRRISPRSCRLVRHLGATRPIGDVRRHGAVGCGARRVRTSRAPSIQDPRYTVADSSQVDRPAAEPALTAVAHYEVAGVPVEVRDAGRRGSKRTLPYGYELRELVVVPAVAVTLSPGQAVVPLAKRPTRRSRARRGAEQRWTVDSAGTLTLKLPAGWISSPRRHPFSSPARASEALYQFTVTVPALENREYRIEAVATSGGRRFAKATTSSSIAISRRGTSIRRRRRRARRRREDRARPEGRLRDGHRRRGAGGHRAARRRGDAARRAGSGDRRSEPVRRDHDRHARLRGARRSEDLQPAAARLREERRQPDRALQHAGVRARSVRAVPGGAAAPAEEVSEEDSPVEILAPADPVFNTPNRITKADFDGWVEQRGSKFCRRGTLRTRR